MVHDLCGTVTGFVGDSLPRTGRGWWRWFRWQREQQRKLHGLVCSAPAVWPVPNGQPQAGDLIHRTDKRKVLLCSTGESTPWDRPQRKARYKCTHMCKRGTALWQRPHNTARVSQAAAKNKSLSVRSFHTQGQNPVHILRGEPCRTMSSRPSEPPPRCGRGCTEPTRQLWQSLQVATAVSPGLSQKHCTEFLTTILLSSCKCVPGNSCRLALLPL